MSQTVSFHDDGAVRMTAEALEVRPPDRLEFTAEGVVSVSESLLSEFEGSTLQPIRVDVSVDGSDTVEIDLEERASLRLASVDVGVETPDLDDLPTTTDEIRSSSDGLPDSPGTIAFTVEGEIRGVLEESVDAIEDADPTLESITFAVEDPVRSDGGTGDDVIFEFVLLGYGITIYRNGTLDIGTPDA